MQIIETKKKKNYTICLTPLFIVLCISYPLVQKFNSDITSLANCALSLFVLLITSLCSSQSLEPLSPQFIYDPSAHFSLYMIDTFVEFYFLKQVSNLLF